MTQGVGGNSFGNTLGEAFIAFHANTAPLKKELEDSLKQVDKEANKLTRKMGQSWGKNIGEGVSDELEKPTTGDTFIKAISNAIKKSKETVTADVKVKIDADVDRSFMNRTGSNIVSSLKDSVTRASRRGFGPGGLLGHLFNIGGEGAGAAAGGAGAFSGLGKGLTGLLSSIGSSVGNVGAAGPAAPIIGGVIIAAIMALVGAVSALLNVFGPLLYSVFLLPAGIGAIVAAVIPLTLAFDGLGEAASALISGDMEKIAETMNKLGNAGQEVARDLSILIPYVQEAKKAIQEAFLIPIANNSVLERLQTALGPTIVKGLQNVATAAGTFAANLATAAENPSIQRFLDTVFMLATSLYNNTSSGFNTFLVGLADVGTATGPYLENLTKLLGEGLGDFGAWLTRISQDGTLQGFLDKLTIAVDGLFRLGDSAWDLIKTVVGQSGEEGRAMEFLDMLIFAIDSLTNFFASELGQESIKGMITLAEGFVIVLAVIIVAFAEIAALVEGIRWTFERSLFTLQLILYLLGAYDGKARGLGGVLATKAIEMGAVKTPFAEGGIVGHRIDGATIGEAGPEAIIPLTNPRRAMELMNQSGLSTLAGGGMSFGPGAITINFNGGVPTRDEAFRTGGAVADGINNGMAQRNTRMAVRTL